MTRNAARQAQRRPHPPHAAPTWPMDAPEQLLGLVESCIGSEHRVAVHGRRAIGGRDLGNVWCREGHAPEQLGGCQTGQQPHQGRHQGSHGGRRAEQCSGAASRVVELHAPNGPSETDLTTPGSDQSTLRDDRGRQEDDSGHCSQVRPCWTGATQKPRCCETRAPRSLPYGSVPAHSRQPAHRLGPRLQQREEGAGGTMAWRGALSKNLQELR